MGVSFSVREELISKGVIVSAGNVVIELHSGFLAAGRREQVLLESAALPWYLKGNILNRFGGEADSPVYFILHQIADLLGHE